MGVFFRRDMQDGTGDLLGSEAEILIDIEDDDAPPQNHHNGKTNPRPFKRERVDPNTPGLTVEEAQRDDYFGGSALEAVEEGTEEKDYIVRLKNIHKTYLLGLEGVPALRGITLSIKRGEFICIYGTSGGGKTSLLNIIGTIDKPTKGEMFVNDTRITFNTSDKVLADLRLKELGFVFQTFNLLSNLTAVENVMMPLVLDGTLDATERRKLALSQLEKVGMSERVNHVPSQLSGGEQQRVTIARSLVNSPSVLLLDEPTGDLDTVNTAIVMKLLMDVNAAGTTLIMVTHDVGLKYFADRIIWLRDGKIQRIEHVSERKRQETMDNLHKELEALGLAQSNKRSHQEADAEPVAPENHFKNTQIRKPTDYRTHKDFSASNAAVLTNFAT